MRKTILITESQKRVLLRESVNKEVGDMVKQNYEFAKNVINQTSEQIGLNLQFLITWGASIGGFVGPLNEFIQGKFPDLSEMEVSLILTGVIASYYIDNKDTINKIFIKIKEEGLSDILKKVLNKTDKFLAVFLDFISSLGITFHKITNMLSYTFIIPLLGTLYSISKNMSITSQEIEEIVLRISSFGLLTVSGIIVKQLISKIVKRFKEKKED
jgi:hypothetical protein